MGLISLAGTGGFQSPSGEPIALGKLTARLLEDIQLEDSQICAGRIVTFALDANGDVVSGSLWAPALYVLTTYTAQGQLVWSMQVNFASPYYYSY
jgi:hypothetical protein